MSAVLSSETSTPASKEEMSDSRPSSQPKAEEAVPGWLEEAREESFFDEEGGFKPTVHAVFSSKEVAVGFLANFYAARIVNYAEASGRELRPGHLEDQCHTMMGRPVREVLAYYHDDLDITVTVKGGEYEVKVFGNTMRDEEVKAAYERSLTEPLVDLEVLGDWDEWAFYDRWKEKSEKS